MTGDETAPRNERRDAVGTPALGSAVLRGGSFAALSLFSRQIISFVGFIILARLAAPETFGEYSAASILIGWSALFTEAGMQAAVVQREDRKSTRLNSSHANI